MALMTAEQYIDSLRPLRRTAYVLGEKVDNTVDHPLIRSQIEATAETYRYAQDPRYENLLTTTSHLTQERINRFTHISQGAEDLIARAKVSRLLGQTTGTCWMRCTGLDAMNTAYMVAYDIDQKYGSQYSPRIANFVRYVQKHDLTCHMAMTDVKGDRALRPSEQANPDMYLRIVDRNRDGIVVRGAKAHQSGALNAHECFAGPGTALRENEKDYAVAFSVPTDTKGLIYVYGRGPMDTRELEGVDLGNLKYSKYACLLIFDDVFVPWERVFMCGEWEFASSFVTRFSSFHRQSHGGCKAGVGDVLAGAAQTIAEYNGVANASHIKEKITDILHMSETLYGCALACAVEGKATPSGAYYVDEVLANAAKLHETKYLAEMSRLVQDIAGGLVATMPSDKDYANPDLTAFLDKYLQGTASVPTTDRMKMIRLIEKMCFESRDHVSNVHGAGSPQAQRISILRAGRLQDKARQAKALAGIETN